MQSSRQLGNQSKKVKSGDPGDTCSISRGLAAIRWRSPWGRSRLPIALFHVFKYDNIFARASTWLRKWRNAPGSCGKVTRK
jgi:hypothetical protein